MVACAAFYKESRIKFVDPTKPHRKSGGWDTRGLVHFPPRSIKRILSIALHRGEKFRLMTVAKEPPDLVQLVLEKPDLEIAFSAQNQANNRRIDVT
jgi:hypothetical protein